MSSGPSHDSPSSNIPPPNQMPAYMNDLLYQFQALSSAPQQGAAAMASPTVSSHHPHGPAPFLFPEHPAAQTFLPSTAYYSTQAPQPISEPSSLSMPLPLQDTPADTSYHQILELLRMQQSAVPEGSPNGWDNRAESQDTPDSRSQLFSPVSSSYSSLVALGISTPVSPSALSFTNFYALQVSPPEPAFVFGTEASPATAPVAGLGNVADHTTTTPLVTSPTELNRASSSPNHNTPAPVADARSISADPLLLFGQGSPRSSNHNVSRESSQGAAAELIDPALAAAGSNRGFAAGTNGTRTLLRRSRGARARRQPPRQTRRSSAGAFSPQAQRALRALLFNIRDNPYPDDETIRGLEGEYRLSTKQIRNWFALRRHRHMVRPEIPGIQAWRLRDDSNP